MIIFAFIFFVLVSLTFAELKSSYNIPKKLTAEEMKDGPSLSNSVMYPQWGVPCTNFTYKVMYQDEKGREPEYVRINLNGKWHDMIKKVGSAKSGALYVYYYVPTSTRANFFYMEASNGVGKARAAIIDSPDQGPVLYTEKFDNNQIILLDKNGKEIWTYDTLYDQVEGVAISKDGNYIAAVTNQYIYLFSKESKEPLWSYCENCRVVPMASTNMAGIAISADGNYIAAALQSRLYFFEKGSNKPLWTKDIESSAIGIDMSDDANVMAIGTANAGKKGDKLFLFDKEGNKLGEYRATHPDYEQTGNFYQPDVTPDGKYVSSSTGCPDRRAYLFSGQGDLLFRSEQLTYDSPVHKSAISDDGSLIAYSLDHSQGKDIVILFNKEGKKLWGFSSQNDATSRAISISADGNYIASGTSAGNIYLFSKNNNKPLWKFSESGLNQIGEVKLNAEGSLLAAGGTSKKIYLFSKESNSPLWKYDVNTWITKLDFNGEYIVAGTGLREYIGEYIAEEKDFQCNEIIQPISMEEMERYSEEGTGEREERDFEGKIVCGDGMCVPSIETYENCPQDCCGENCDENLDEGEIEKKSKEIEGFKEREDISSVKEKEKKGLFQLIIGFFSRLFGK
ncbi:MAG: hypothetical protein UT11_C0005G0035 [Berkelbacteria bacterium GW2011_GWA2_38_9]|uniref:Uncharacterized protein n=1 Tax=Berkelbacteria bacterium GW2011_GWA2_38_9 TaxID=1618334 RepID=A0A0G0NX98_9BACT|nr:MAG: hypothetical protein UT11_C0005G0035 [Berkelbacteria bacterium GW2011_GWA2_38_9]